MQSKNIFPGILVGCILLIILLVVCCLSTFIIAAAADGGSIGDMDAFEIETLQKGEAGKVAVVSLEGVIADQQDGIHRTSNVEYILNSLEEAMADENTVAVVLMVNTPGGTVYDSDKITRKLQEVESKGIVTVAVVEEIGASGGYWIASEADYIFADVNSINGSIGVLMQFIVFDELFNKVGVEQIAISNTEGTNKISRDIDNPESESTKIYKGMLDEIFERFVEQILANRDITRQQLLKNADGRILSSQQALEGGLIDEIGTYQDAISYLETELGTSDLEIEEYLWSELFGFESFGSRIMSMFRVNGIKPENSATLYLLPEYYFSQETN